jgi:hypothetical protein
METEEFNYGGWREFILISEGKKKWGWQSLVRAQNGSRDVCMGKKNSWGFHMKDMNRRFYTSYPLLNPVTRV